MTQRPIRFQPGLSQGAGTLPVSTDNAEGMGVNLADPRPWHDASGELDSVNRRYFEQHSNWIDQVARIGDLPVDTALAPIRPGSIYAIRDDFDGKELDRLVMWDPTAAQTGGIAVIQAFVDPADVALVQAEAAKNSQFPGEPFDIGNRDAVFTVIPLASGRIQVQVTNPGTGYRIGEEYNHPGLADLGGRVRFVVERLTGASPHGGWVYLNHKSWVKELVTEPNQSSSFHEGDFQSTTEADKKELWVYHNGAWQLLFGEQEIRQWIAALNSFQGTVQEPGGPEKHAEEFTALPDLQALQTNGDLNRVGHYWIFQGTPGHVVNASDGPIHPDLKDAELHPGDWVMIANRGGDGTGVGPNGSPIRLEYVKVSGDLLSKSRGDALYGLNNWTNGNHEKSTVVQYGGDLWRAKDDVLPGDRAPGDTGGKPQRDNFTLNARPADGVTLDLEVLGPTGPTVNITHTVAAGDTIQSILEALVTGFNNNADASAWGRATMSVAGTDGIVTGLNDGDAFLLQLTGDLAASNAIIDNPVAPQLNKWERVNLAGGVKYVTDDGQLPIIGAPAGQLYFVLSSAQYGNSSGAIVYWDPLVGQWRSVNDNSLALQLQGGDIIYEKHYLWDEATTMPDGKYTGDLLFATKNKNKVYSWDNTQQKWDLIFMAPGQVWSQTWTNQTCGHNQYKRLTGVTPEPLYQNRRYKIEFEIHIRNSDANEGQVGIRVLGNSNIEMTGQYRSSLRYPSQLTNSYSALSSKFNNGSVIYQSTGNYMTTYRDVWTSGGGEFWVKADMNVSDISFELTYGGDWADTPDSFPEVILRIFDVGSMYS